MKFKSSINQKKGILEPGKNDFFFAKNINIVFDVNMYITRLDENFGYSYVQGFKGIRQLTMNVFTSSIRFLKIALSLH